MVDLIAQIVFWFSVAALFYVYAGYPILVYLVSLVFPKKVKRGFFQPKVTILITAYNEEKAIRQKLENTFAIDYPQEKLEIIVASDGSTDKTDEIVKEFAARGVRLFRQEGRAGKTITQNNAVRQATGEIILFSDATTDYRQDVLHEILPNFADESVGCVAGKLIYIDRSASNVGKGAKSYWNYETFLKRSESRACSLIGASGCLYAVRRSAYRPMYAEACSDFLICTLVYEQGLRSVYEPRAVCTENTNRQTDKEMKMRVRVISQTFTDLWRNRKMLNPFRSGFYAVELVSHKVLRYAVPLFLLLIFVSNAVLISHSLVIEFAFIAQICFYLLAFIGWAFEKMGARIGVFAIPHYFVLANLASAIGFYKFLRGERYATWEPIREKMRNARRFRPLIKPYETLHGRKIRRLRGNQKTPQKFARRQPDGRNAARQRRHSRLQHRAVR
jgi:cellulose synthase/poly-beta-1,6-N-acetylglucosamine synthase-like glycosyltransferase